MMRAVTFLLLPLSATSLAFAPMSILSTQTGMSNLDPVVKSFFDTLPLPADKVRAEYIWIDRDGATRSKTRTLPKAKTSLEQLPSWNFDGSSTGQAPGDDSEVIIVPRASYPDPFRPHQPNLLVLCDAYTPSGSALPTNTRAAAAETFEKHAAEKVWFGLEQEYTLFNLDRTTPLGWPVGGFPAPQGPYYCGAGPENVWGRAVSEAHYAACLFAGLSISGTNGEVMPGQWEYQVGPCVGIGAGDELWLSRHILQRVCEEYQVHCTLHPKPITQGEWNGAGMHTNVSTEGMRKPGGIDKIRKAIDKLAAKHDEHIAVYGSDNDLRLTGSLETASISQFSYGVANRGCSVRIGRDTEADGCGYFEDRRPSSNADPYLVTGKIMDTIMEDVDAPVVKPVDRELAAA